jgi:alpha-glucoside transport system substrate-binding protein
MCVVGCVDGDEPDGRPVVEVFGNVIGDAGEQLGRAMRDVSDGGPVELRYVGVSSFNAQLADRLDRGDRPGIVLLPQPGRLEDLAARGVLAPLDPDLVERLDDLYPSTLVDLASIAGVPRAVWVSVDVKGLVWYRSSMFADRALQVPRTLDEFDSLASDERIDGDTTAPFCLAIEAGASTGWVATDWVENYVLRRLGSDVYDRWTSGSHSTARSSSRCSRSSTRCSVPEERPPAAWGPHSTPRGRPSLPSCSRRPVRASW